MQLEESRKSETNLGREISKKNNQITTLQQQLEESRNDLHHSFQKIESLSEQYEKTIDQQAKITVNFASCYSHFRGRSYTTQSAYRRTKSFFKGSEKKRGHPRPTKCKYFATLEVQFVTFFTLGCQQS